MSDRSPNIVVIAGPNGAGKSTAAPALVHKHFGVLEYVNADVIAQGLAGLNAETVALQAGTLMLERIHYLGRSRRDFAFETTLASRSLAPWLKQLKDSGYQTHLIFLWLPSAEFAASRVALRVQQGGHGIPPDTIRRRYERGVRNLTRLYIPLMTTWRVYDGSATDRPHLIASGIESQFTIQDPRLWSQIETTPHEHS